MSPLAPQLGRPLVELGSGYPPVAALPARGELLLTSSSCFSASGMIVQAGGGFTTSPVWATSKPSAYPFVLDEAVTAYQLGWHNSTAGGNADIGIYDASFNRLVSSGSTACVTNSVWQFVDVADTVLPAGSYYLVINLDNATLGRLQVFTSMSGQANMALAGVMDSGTAQFPLPDPLASMVVAAAITVVPILAIAVRALV